MQMNSPARTRLVKTFDVHGSKLSLLPRIYDVEAVGIGARSKELRAPYFMTSLRSPSQSYLVEQGLTFQRSNWNYPFDKGDPGKVS